MCAEGVSVRCCCGKTRTNQGLFALAGAHDSTDSTSHTHVSEIASAQLRCSFRIGRLSPTSLPAVCLCLGFFSFLSQFSRCGPERGLETTGSQDSQAHDGRSHSQSHCLGVECCRPEAGPMGWWILMDTPCPDANTGNGWSDRVGRW